jgi:uncharacterized protein (DUF433 family)
VARRGEVRSRYPASVAATEEIEGVVMVPAETAASWAGLTRQRLWHWERRGLIEPAARRSLSPRNIVRLYSFDALVELVVAAKLVAYPDISPQHLRSTLERLRRRGHHNPLRELRFAVAGNEIFFQEEDGSWEGSRKPNQMVEIRVLDLEHIKATLRKVVRRGRPKAVQGRVVTHRNVLGSKPVFDGTRIPVAAIIDFLRAGKSSTAIRRAYPRLTDLDIDKARQLDAVIENLEQGLSPAEILGEHPELTDEELASAKAMTVVA